MATFNWQREYSRYRHYLLNLLDIYKRRDDIQMTLGVLFSLFAISFLGYFALRPTLVTIAGLLTEIKEKEAVVTQMDKKINSLSQAQNFLAAHSGEIELLNKAIPESPEPADYARQIEGLSTKDGVALSNYTVDSVDLVLGANTTVRASGQLPVSPEGVYDYSLVVRSENFDAVKLMTSDIENLLRPMKIEGIILSTKGVSDLTNQISVAINGKVPFLRRKE